KIRHSPRTDVRLPSIEERPTDGTRPEVGHVLILGQPVDGPLQNAIVTPKHRTMTRQEKLRIVLQDALERMDEVRDVRTMMSVDDADAAIFVNIVAAKQQVAQAEAELPGGMARCVPNFQRKISDLDHVSFFEDQVDLAARHGNFDSLRLDGSIGHDL